MCPLVAENMASTWKILDWNFSADAICLLNQYSVNKNTPSKVNVFVFGGSMTVGTDAIGKCCTESTETNLCDSTYSHLDEPLRPNHWYCFWFGYLATWFSHTFPHIEFGFHNMAKGGYRSSVMSTEITTMLHYRKVKFTKNDIIILDHSCNDSIDEPGNIAGIEILIREIYRNCHGFDPTIIIMEQYPNPNPDVTYYKSYRQVAKYYQIPYFSYREIILNPLIHQKDLFAMISSLASHVPWHVHMLISDSFARWITDILEYKCNDNRTDSKTIDMKKNMNSISSYVIRKQPTSSNSISKPNHHHHHSTKTSYTSKYAVSKPFFSEITTLDHFRCYHTHNDTILNIIANSTFLPSNRTQFEDSLKGWTVYQDYPHKPAGYIINNRVHENNRTIDFYFSKFDEYKLNYNNSIGIHINFLKTYVDAGRTKVWLCGEQISVINSMSAQRVSIPNLFYYKLTFNDIQRCQKSLSTPKLSLEYLSGNATVVETIISIFI